MGSEPFNLNRSDWDELVKTFLLAAVSAGLLAVVQLLQAKDFGVWDPFLTALLMSLLKLMQQWMTDTRSEIRS